ncbi:MAG: hypothetical protein IJR08_00840 [Bacilli bacterium]|nr:hypothetical protein [Bacilli bacterium]
MVDIAQITQYFNIGLLVLFLLIAVGLFLAGLRGFLRGIWKSTHNMIFMLSLVLIAFFTLSVLTDFIGSFNLSMFWKGSLYLTREIDGSPVTYYIPITSVKDTLTEVIKGFYTLYNVSASASSASNFAIALTGSVLKIIIFIVEMLLIVTLGNFFSFLTWYLIFQHFIPRIARKLIKLRWVGMLETATTFLVVTFLFMTPFTSLVNSLNQSYQQNRPKTDNQMVQNVGNFVDAYNDSLFAKILFNWTVDSSGMTLDTRLFDTLTTSVCGDCSIGLVGEFANLTNVLVSSATALVSSDESEMTFNPAALVTKNIVDLAFDALVNSDLLTNVFPVITEIALNSDILAEYVPNRLLDLSDVKWNDEIGYVRDMVDCIFESGVIDSMFVTDEQGNREFRSFEGNDIFDFINEIVYSENFNRVLDIFKSIDQSKVLSRAVPAALSFAMNNDEEGNIQKYLPLSWEELNEFSWGYETYIFFDFLHSTVLLDDDFLKAIFIKAGIYTPKEGESVKALQTLISEHAEEFKTLLVGEIVDGQLVNVDKNGQTIVFKNGERIVDEGGKKRNYCFFDMNIVGSVMPTLLDELFEGDLFKDLRGNMTDEDLEPFHQAVRELNNGVRLKNYKLEFDSILDVVVTVAKDEALLDALMTDGNINSLMAEEGNFFSIDQTHINYFKQAIGKMDKSNVLYSALTPILKSFLAGDDVKNTLNDVGLNADVLISAINHDIKRPKESRSLFKELSSVLDRWSDLNTVYSLTSDSGDTDAMMEKLKDQDTIDAFVRILKTLHNNGIINPTPEAGDTYEKNENVYGLLEFVFSMTESMGLTVTRETLREVEQPGHTWDDEFDAIGNILHFIAVKDIMNASEEFSDGLTRSALWKLKESGDGNYDIPGLFAQVDNSYIFSTSLGPFLDEMFGDSLSGFLIDTDNNISFENINDWTLEGQNIKNLMDSLYDIVPVDDEEAKNFLSNFDIKTLNKIVDLNAMLHNLAHSGIFTYIDENNVSHYQFGQWLYGKVDSSMGNFSVDSNVYDLLADPSFDIDSTYTLEDTWGEWGTRPEDNLETADQYFLEWKNKYNADGSSPSTHYIAYRDFVNVRGMANDNPNLPSFWCDYGAFQEKQNAFLAAHKDDLTDDTTYLNNEWGEYYASDDFIADYEDVFAVDEISRVTRFMTYSLRILEPKKDNTKMAVNKMSVSYLDGLLSAINETSCLRICSYNFYRVAEENVFNGYSGFSLGGAYNVYMVDAGVDINDFDAAYDLRAEELDRLVTLYSFVNDANEAGVFDSSGNLHYDKMNDDIFIDKMKNALKGMNDSFVFHRSGSSKVDQKTVFQSLFNTMLGESEIKNVIYLGDNSPKDLNNKTNGLYTDATSKISYLVNNAFLSDKEINTYIEGHSGVQFDDLRSKQHDEVASLLDAINKIYSLKDDLGEQVTNIEDADMKNADNRTTIYELFNILNDSDLLCDLVPNTIYNLFIENDKFSISSGSDSVDFTRVDPFYHYYYNESLVKRSSADFNARYLSSDIDGIYNLLGDYQEYDSLVGTGSINKCSTIMALTGTETAGVFVSNGVLPTLLKHLHGCNLFHSPARDHAWSIYYTNKYEDDGFTLFEEMMSKVCSFVGLDELSFDENYDPIHHAEYTSASAKMTKKISAITEADDTGTSSIPVYYHNEQGHAWDQEIDTIMHLAYTAASVSTDEELNTSTLELDKLEPESIKKMLVITNNSDLVCDSVTSLVKKGFEAINLGTQTTYDTVNYAYYHIGQEAFGGTLGDAPEDSEIDNIYNLMSALAKYDSSDNFDGYSTNVNNLNDYIKGEGGDDDAKGLNGLMRYLYKSHIFNTSQAGVYNEYNSIDGHSFTAQGVLLYNSLGENLTAYVSRDADKSTPAPTSLQKIEAFSRIIHMNQHGDNTYLIEAKGIQRLVNLVDGHIDASTFSSGDIETVKANKELILDIIEVSYNVGSPYAGKRSALASEFISGVLNNILENQYDKLDTNYPSYRYVAYSFGQDNDDGVLNIDDYSSLNEIERNGLEGILNSLTYMSGGDALVVAANIKAHMSDIRDNFTLMGSEVGKNSEIARVIYLSEAHPLFKNIATYELVPGSGPAIKDSHGDPFVPVDETSINPNQATPIYNIYSSAFTFDWYGQYIEAFFNDVTLS